MGKDMSNDQVSSMKEAFTLFDTDGDGKIAPSELGILMRSLGGNPTQAQLKSIIAEENLNSPFDFNRFFDLMSKHLKPEPFDRQLRDAFKVLDKDGTGSGTRTSLPAWLPSEKQFHPPCSLNGCIVHLEEQEPVLFLEQFFICAVSFAHIILLSCLSFVDGQFIVWKFEGILCYVSRNLNP
ncbi:unnamed protein product [Fraxinus pennsylvanica]|uniref:EF-hand domain-containing protein n=1 Tax=Fraxinus pennsylvanica TaxID=56036 RepID=A0AAD1ZFA2_9LAMI|nr:unnamed protein product [Fraxinus pennsylvanica]